jgi:hypothetical protein
MANYCKQCSVDLGAPEGWSDWTEEPGREPFVDLCEGCGFVLIAEDGSCIGEPAGEPCYEGHLASAAAVRAQQDRRG